MNEHYRTPVILMYHSVRDSVDGGPYGIEITPEKFESQIDFLTSYFRVMPLVDFIDALNSGARTEGMAAITFDDAFEDNLSAAAPILRKYSAPATVFAPTGYIGRSYFWWDALPRLWSAAPERLAEAEQAIRTRFPDIAPQAASSSAQFQTAVWDRLRRVPMDLAYQFTEEFAARLGVSLENLPRPATESELPQFGRWPFDLGSHGVSHRVLSSLTMDDMHEEARSSRRFLQDRIGRPPATFCYPFGLSDRDVRNAVRDAGYAGAVNVMSSDAPILNYGDLFDLPRIDGGFEDAGNLAVRMRKVEEINAGAFIAARSARFASVAANAQQQPKGASQRERNSDRPDVSIIIPVFNAAPYLEECLDSVLGQSLETIEVICVDDASTDDSAKILQEAADRDPRVRVLSNPDNLGAGPSRNRGLDAARGRFLRVVDADDLLPRDSTQVLLSRAVASGADLVRGALTCFADPDPGKIEFVIATRDRVSTTFFDDRELWIPYWHPSYLLASDLLHDGSIRYPALQYGEDPVFMAKVLTKSRRTSVIADVVYLYRRYPKSTGSLGGNFAHVVDFFRHASLVKALFLECHPPAWIEGYGAFLKSELRGLLSRCTLDGDQTSYVNIEAQKLWGNGELVVDAVPQDVRNIAELKNVRSQCVLQEFA
ncbi:glycosyltransferase [Rhodoblastus acidophilus]|uniref:Chitooligosaccharide deacetylase n=1 Tax=Rhodoblastus acidophilus TaxID=1074 RepID=A0A6N8DR08_RHOAC|nr:glycosyltransferase [Rhodoblastus acidophilus]MCW2274668.1 glycosyltransferase involved in cell wall biosynthesis/peptidoglycan/xylan/chitin deacetylase (PgdA/CDA1 family) [Rhodoblastus acidophilus]MTV31623.1 glycosyltransferase [Rhodoblastus acidophilus]